MNLWRRSNLTSNPELVAGRSAAAQELFEQAVYEWGRILTTFYPPGRWRVEKEWQRRRDFR